MNFEQARQNMIENQVRTWEVLDPRVLEVMSGVRREDFVPPAYRNMAFADLPLPIGHGESMMKPIVEGRLLQALAPTSHEQVLEIGTGSGFITACLARLAHDVISIDIHADFVEAAGQRLSAAGIDNVALVVAEAINAYHPSERFDAIAVTAAVASVPERLLHWLKPYGRMFVVRGTSPAMEAVLLRHEDGGRYREQSLFETDMAYLSHAAPPKPFEF